MDLAIRVGVGRREDGLQLVASEVLSATAVDV